MGKVGGTTTANKKKKGRPSLVDLKKQALEQHQSQNQQQLQRRFTRRNPNSAAAAADDASIDEDDYYDDDDDERKEKKVKLVVRLPELNQQQHLSSGLIRSSSVNSASCCSDLNADVDNRKINSGSGDILTHHQGGKVLKAMDTEQASPLESGPTTPLPDKKLLVFILDRLQKKDTRGVFSEPVDRNELPDYHEIIEQPMDFGTVKNKLDQGLYSNLEELEADVLLICSNAMQYNTSDTIYFRQARSIQELAKRDFENLRQEGDDGELQPKVVRRGRPPSKHLKKPPGRPPLDVESTSGATLATAEDNTTESTPYNLRRGVAPMSYNKLDRSRNGEQYSELLADWNEDFPAHIRKADMKYGNKHFNIDETRRDTYKQFHHHSLLSNFGGERKHLLAVGLHAEHGYARSLSRFTANMGPIVRKIASKKIEKALPAGVTFENEPETPSTSGIANTRMSKFEVSGIKPNIRNDSNGVFGSNLSKMGMFQGTISDTQGTSSTGNLGKASCQPVSVSVPPDLNVGPRHHPDLALQL